MPSKFLPDRGLGEKVKNSKEKRTERRHHALDTLHHTIRRKYEPGSLQKFALSEMARGDAVHAVLARIEFVDGDVAALIDKAVRQSGLETQSEINDDIRKALAAFLDAPEAVAFFSVRSDRQVYCEKEFANPSGMLYRLDRVIVDADAITVVDFKTGGDELEKEYREQVRNYISLLRDVYPGRKVSGVLAYVDMLQLRPVE